MLLITGTFGTSGGCANPTENDRGADDSAEKGDSANGNASGGGSADPDGGPILVPGSPDDADRSPPPEPEPWALPEGFSAETFGGFRLGPAIPESGNAAPQLPADAPGTNGRGCGTTIVGVIRDFRDDHPDFEGPCCGLLQGIVEDAIGRDRKPVYAHVGATSQTSGPDNFDQWYNTVEGVNRPHWIYINLEPNGDVYTFQSDAFFPLDGAGWGNQGRAHNFHFTTEIHTRFLYKGGEIFRFTGDDDVFVFINDRLVIDLGGVHLAMSAEVDLDAVAGEIGLTTGERYDLDLFQAERRTSESNFRIDTTLELVNCGYVPPPIVR